MPLNRNCETMRPHVRPDCVVLHFLLLGLLGVLYEVRVWILCTDSTCCATWCQQLYGRPYFHEIHCRSSLHNLVDRAWASWKSAVSHFRISWPIWMKVGTAVQLHVIPFSSCSAQNSWTEGRWATVGQVEIGAVQWLAVRAVRSRWDLELQLCTGHRSCEHVRREGGCGRQRYLSCVFARWCEEAAVRDIMLERL